MLKELLQEQRHCCALVHVPKPSVLNAPQYVHLGSMETQQAGAIDTSSSRRELVVLSQKSTLSR